MKRKLPSIKDIEVPLQFESFKNKLNQNAEIISNQVVKLSEEIKHIDKIPVVQSEMLVLRSKINDEIMQKQIKLQELEYKVAVQRKNVLLFYKTESDIKMSNYHETAITLDADIAPVNIYKEMLIQYIAFLQENRKMLNDMGYSIKNRIELEQYLI